MASIEDTLAVQQLYVAYTAAVDKQDWDAWVELFTDEAEYKLQPRENYEAGLPLATMWLLSKNMLRDRAYAIRETLFHDPYYQRHLVETPMIVGEEDGVLVCEANYAVFRTKRDGPSTVFNVGRYLDRVVRTADGLRFARRWCVFDTELVPNSIIYPV